MKLKIYLSFVILATPLVSLYAQTVNTQFGQIQGNLNGSVYQFLGIPFAKPPVGLLRWKAPQNPDNWTGTINTLNFAPVCPQKTFDQGSSVGVITGNEDCLYLNIWTPQTGPGNRPVMVFIHGGGNQQGSASEENAGTQMYFGKNMAERGNVVNVTIQYRLGPLGFLVHPGLEPENVNNVSGNYAVLDQILALTWVKNNIANFGGDPSKVMIFGESAGGINVGNLLTTPLATGLFQRACIESGVPVINDYNDSKNRGISYVDSFTTTGTDAQKIAYMRSLSSDSLVKNENPPLNGGAVGLNWQPVVDHVVFNDFPYQIFKSGNFNKVPLIIGSNSEEMSLSAPATVLPVMVTALIDATIPVSLRPQANLLYPPGTDNLQARQSYIGILTDAQFTATTRRTAQCVSINQTEPVWRYFFTHKHTIPILAELGSYHGMELFYVFNNWENATLGMGPLFHPQDDSVQKAMLNYWVNFANTGDPNEPGFANWPQSFSSNDCYLEIKATPDGSQCGVRTAQSDLWDNSINYISCAGIVPVRLVSFEAVTSNCTTILKWKTANEQGIKEYDIEQSTNGSNFLKAGSVTGNNTATESSYQYNFLLRTGTNHFFRLKIIDQDSSYTYSKVIEVMENCGNGFMLDISPNPVSEKLFLKVTLPAGCNTNITIFSLTGKKIYTITKTFNAGENSFQLDAVTNLHQGAYVLKAENQYGVITRKFVKL